MAKDSFADAQNEFKNLKKSIKEEKVNYIETANQLKKLRRECWRKRGIAEGCRNAITWFPIVPIIIPTPVDIN